MVPKRKLTEFGGGALLHLCSPLIDGDMSRIVDGCPWLVALEWGSWRMLDAVARCSENLHLVVLLLERDSSTEM